MNIIIKNLILKDIYKAVREGNIIYDCCFRKYEILKFQIMQHIYYFKVHFYNRFNNKSEYIL
jgi:hypothetical protein